MQSIHLACIAMYEICCALSQSINQSSINNQHFIYILFCLKYLGKSKKSNNKMCTKSPLLHHSITCALTSSQLIWLLHFKLLTVAIPMTAIWSWAKWSKIHQSQNKDVNFSTCELSFGVHRTKLVWAFSLREYMSSKYAIITRLMLIFLYISLLLLGLHKNDWTGEIGKRAQCC